MPSVNWLQFQMEPLLENPAYTHLFVKRNKSASGAPFTPQGLAKSTAVKIVECKMLVDPVIVGELWGPVELYRAHDGGKNANSVGQCWFDRDLLENFVRATKEMPAGRNRNSHIWHLIRACNLVLFEWNQMTNLSRMQVPAGERIVVVAGDGSWGAMLPKGGPRADSPEAPVLPPERRGQLPYMAKEPTTQYIVPLLDEDWVHEVRNDSPTWPLA